MPGFVGRMKEESARRDAEDARRSRECTAAARQREREAAEACYRATAKARAPRMESHGDPSATSI